MQKYKAQKQILFPVLISVMVFASSANAQLPKSIFLSCDSETKEFHFKIEENATNVMMFDDSKFQYESVCKSNDGKNWHEISQNHSMCLIDKDTIVASTDREFGIINTEILTLFIKRTTGYFSFESKIYLGRFEQEKDIKKYMEFISQEPISRDYFIGKCRIGDDQSKRKRAF